MKKMFLSAALLLSLSSAFSQTALPELSKHPINSVKEANANTKYAIKAADYLLTTPVDKTNKERETASAYLAKWMEDVSGYTFAFDKNSAKFKGDMELYMVYIAAMSKYQVNNRVKVVNDNDSLKIWETFAKYVTTPANNTRPNNEIKILAEAYKQGKLKAYLHE